MKKLLILVFFMVIAINTQAASLRTTHTAISGNPSYEALENFQEGSSDSTIFIVDTLSYLITNFETNKAFYIGKPLSVLLDDTELPIKSGVTSIKYFESNGLYKITLFVVDYDKALRPEIVNNVVKYKLVKPLVSIDIIFSQEIPETEWKTWTSYFEGTIKNSTAWNLVGRTYYGGRVIQDIKVH